MVYNPMRCHFNRQYTVFKTEIHYTGTTILSSKRFFRLVVRFRCLNVRSKSEKHTVPLATRAKA